MMTKLIGPAIALVVVLVGAVKVMESGGDLNKAGESALEELNKSGNEDAAKAVQGVIHLFHTDKE